MKEQLSRMNGTKRLSLCLRVAALYNDCRGAYTGLARYPRKPNGCFA